MYLKTVFSLFLVLCLCFGSCSKKNSDLPQSESKHWWQVHPRPIYSKLEKIGTFQKWFDVYKLNKDTYAIYEPNQFEEVISYLVIGNHHAALIDTGTGIGNIKSVVAQLTNLPVKVILTHEHYDHVGDAERYKDISFYNNATALKALKAGKDNAYLQGFISKDYLWKPLPKNFDSASWVIPAIEPTDFLRDGDLIELGGRTLEIIYTPGHTPGSICILDRTNRILFTGDHFYPGPLYTHLGNSNIENYIASNKKLSSRLKEYDYVCSGHNDPWVKSEVIPRVSAAFDTIFNDKGKFVEKNGLRRYHFKGFDILIQIKQLGK